MNLPCLFCGDDDSDTTVNVSDGLSLKCSQCEHEFTPACAAARLDQLNRDWAAVLAWLAQHPEREGRAKK